MKPNPLLLWFTLSHQRVPLFNFLWIIFIIATVSLNHARADNSQVLILNSNASIPKYQQPQQAFEQEKLYPSKRVNLEDKSFNAANIKLLSQKSDIIYAIGSSAYRLAVEQADADKPIVFSTALNWKRLPLRANTYGVANELPAGRQLMMYRYLFPELEKIGIIYSPKINKEWLQEAIETSQELNIKIISVAINDENELDYALGSLLNEVDALWIIPDPAIASKNALLKIFDISKKMQKPIFAYHEVFINLGALLIISADIPTISQQVISLMGDILENKPIEKRVISPAGSHVIFNMKELKQYRLRLNTQALDSINKIIE